jgi:hypothetical protein
LFLHIDNATRQCIVETCQNVERGAH